MILNSLSMVRWTVRWFSVVLFVVAPCATAGWSAEAGRHPPERKVVVSTHLGPVSGVICDDVHVYRGVPYAAPPVGHLRWRKPEDPAPWTDVRPCEEFGPVCPQPEMGLLGQFAVGPDAPMSEDCLYLNVFTREPNGKNGLPVMVWIHGGGFYFGAGSAPRYDGKQLAQRDVVVVTFNYRLGMFGFLAHENLTRETGGLASGNYGLWDQIHALNWVRTNIGAFGGDPQNVTIFGESAGGVSVCALMSSQIKSIPFQRAICQSGGAIGELRLLDEAPPGCLSGHDLGDEFAERLGVPDGELAEMRAKTWEQVLAAYPQPGGGSQRSPFTGGGVRTYLMVDGHVLRQSPADVFQAGGQKQVPLLIGSNRDEGTLFNYPPWRCPWTKYWSLWRQIPLPLRGEFRDVYPAWNYRSAAQAVTQWVGDEITCATRVAAREHAGRGHDTYQYEFARAPRWAELAWLGAFHSAEIPYVFGNSPSWPRFAEFDGDDWDLSEKMQWYWVNFADTSDPNQSNNQNAPSLPPWPKHTSADDRYLILDVDVGTGQELRREQCEFRQRVPRTCGSLPQYSPYCPGSTITPHCAGCGRSLKFRLREGEVTGSDRSRCRVLFKIRRRAR